MSSSGESELKNSWDRSFKAFYYIWTEYCYSILIYLEPTGLLKQSRIS